MENELKEHRTFECVQLFNPDLQGEMARTMLRLPLVMPVDGMDECARGVFLRAKRAVVSFSSGPRITAVTPNRSYTVYRSPIPYTE